jgi:hypothetical protein
METVKTYDKAMGMFSVGELIEALKQYPADTPIDFGLLIPGEDEVFEESVFSGVHWRACRVSSPDYPELHRGACRVSAPDPAERTPRVEIGVVGPLEDPDDV